MQVHEPIRGHETPKRYPWLVYLLVDPTTTPTNHPQGTVFYVGNRLDLARYEPLDMRDLLAPESIPEDEAPARERLQALVDEGVDVVIQVVTDSVNYGPRSLEVTQAQTIGAIVATMHPRPLNTRANGILWSADLAQRVSDAVELDLPVDAILARTRGEAPLAELATMTQDDLFQASIAQVPGMRHTPTTAATLRESGPRPLLLVVGGHRRPYYKLPAGFVLGAWMVESIEPDPDQPDTWRVTRADDLEETLALQRHFVHRVVEYNSAHLGSRFLMI